MIRLLPMHRLPAHRTVPHTSITVLLTRNERLRETLVAVDVAAVRGGGVGEALHADDALALADRPGFTFFVGLLLCSDGLFLLGLEELFFGGGGFVGEVELFDFGVM